MLRLICINSRVPGMAKNTSEARADMGNQPVKRPLALAQTGDRPTQL
jgi:hypothetical protein